MKNRFMRAGLWLVSLLVLFVVIGLSLIPQPPTPVVSDKLAHAAAYAVLVQSVLLAGVWAPRLGEGRWANSHVLIVGCAICLGAVIEIVQGAYFARTPDGFDAIANAVGTASSAAAWYGLRRVSARASLKG
jgi:hypothetical protein